MYLFLVVGVNCAVIHQGTTSSLSVDPHKARCSHVQRDVDLIKDLFKSSSNESAMFSNGNANMPEQNKQKPVPKTS